MKKVTLDDRYELGGGLGSWAKSYENGVKVGDMRNIGDVPMSAYTIYSRGFFRKDVVNWTPVDKVLCHDFSKLKAWMNS